MQNFKENINNDNFNKAFIIAYSVLNSYQQLNDNFTINNLKEFISNIINERIVKQIQMEAKDSYWSEIATDLIKFISNYNDRFIFSEDILNVQFYFFRKNNFLEYFF